MTPKSLFNIILKVMGIIFIKDFITVFPEIFSSIYYFSKGINYYEEVTFIFLPLFTLVIYGILIHYLVFRTEWVISRLKLEKHFDQEFIEINLHRSSILNIIILLVGILILVDSIPVLISNMFFYVTQSELSFGAMDYNLDFQPSLVAGLKIIISFILLTNNKSIVNWIELRRKKQIN